MHAGPLLPDLHPGSNVYAKPPTSSSTKASIPGRIAGSAGPRSYYIQTGNKRTRRNQVQVQLAPPQNSSSLPSTLESNLTLPEGLRPHSVTATSLFTYPQSRQMEGPPPMLVTPDSNNTTFLAPETTPSTLRLSSTPSTPETPPTAPHPSPVLQSHVPARTPTLPCSTTPRSPVSFPVHEPTSSPKRTVTRSGRVIRPPARYSD